MWMGRDRISLEPGLRKLRLEGRGTGSCGMGWGKGGQSTLLTYSSSSDTEIPMSINASPRSSSVGSVRPTEGERQDELENIYL